MGVCGRGEIENMLSSDGFSFSFSFSLLVRNGFTNTDCVNRLMLAMRLIALLVGEEWAGSTSFAGCDNDNGAQTPFDLTISCRVSTGTALFCLNVFGMGIPAIIILPKCFTVDAAADDDDDTAAPKEDDTYALALLSLSSLLPVFFCKEESRLSVDTATVPGPNRSLEASDGSLKLFDESSLSTSSLGPILFGDENMDISILVVALPFDGREARRILRRAGGEGGL